jgi:MYXO-CTERM domain-containing protein
VEDGYFDRATILVDGAPVWRSFGSADEKSATFHHTDREWRFHDVDLSGHTADGRLTIEFGLESDGGLEFGGWSIDGLCVVGVGAPASCGDGVRDAVEECDDGNRVSGDGCSAQCTVEDPSTGGGETGESGEPGGASSGDTDGIGDTDGVGLRGDGLLDRGCACRTRSRDPAERGPWVLLALGLLGLRRRGRNREV